MRPVTPTYENSNMKPIIFAEHQEEYEKLPALVGDDGMVLTAWELDDAERAMIAAGGRLLLWVHTFRRGLQPVRLEVEAAVKDHPFVACRDVAHVGPCPSVDMCHHRSAEMGMARLAENSAQATLREAAPMTTAVRFCARSRAAHTLA